MWYKIIRGTNYKLIGHKFYGNTIDEVIASVEEQLGTFETKESNNNNTQIKLRDSNLMIVLEVSEEGE